MKRGIFVAAVLLAVAAALAAAPRDGLDRAVAGIGAKRGVRTVDIWIQGERAASATFHGADRGPWDIKSASKSILSALVGIGLESGKLPGLDAPVGTILPEHGRQLPAEKRAITLRHLLTMSSGLGSTSGEHYGRWVGSGDWVKTALARPREHPPGREFTYSTGNSHLVAASLTRATGEDLLAWGRRVLFDPIGLEVASWERDPQGRRFGGNSFIVTPEHLGWFGLLYLAKGQWNGRRLVPPEWIALSTQRHAEGWPDRYGAYGLLWWIPFTSEPAYLAVGYGGQFLLVAPESACVVVVTSTHDGKGAAWDRDVLRRLEHEVLPAARAQAARR